MNTGLWILLIVVALLVGAVLGFFIARRSMESYLQKNPPISEEMMRQMMTNMGRKPSQKQLKQTMAQMKQAQQQSNKK
ncbi:hypothetical protein WOSG25_030470 [Weissella oryzae SG25]|uniref:UPF0154 protein WOSG25_030470 n=1 Tax=Weissella oryzae (strain DSM 25784 / JCM 18191 / LMG 30913 / SG25) TaxID=1329250 RepID=A0A069CRP9_WEIOS|nr:YneF family protein [Weissella oryzae]GAK30450.1 hypothetical protein WOSG25_030470 [Weissella oryzae SG25]